MMSLQEPFDVAVITTTTLRPSLKRAVQSIFDQDYSGRVQILLGIDKHVGDIAIIDEMQQACPENMALTIIDLGYSTAAANGGLYTAFSGGAMRTMLSYAANSRYITYLDDDNWYAPYHLDQLLMALQGNAWAFSLRWFVDEKTNEILCVDDFVSVGNGKGVFAKAFGGFVDTNCMVLDKMQFHGILPFWCNALMKNGTAADQRVSQAIRKMHLPHGFTGRPSVYYVIEYRRYPFISDILRQRGIIQ